MTNATPAPVPPRPKRLLLAAPALLLAISACSPAGAPTTGPGSTGSPTSSPGADPTTDPTPTTVAGLEHPTGAKDIVLRFEQGGGFVPVEFMATNAPSFTLYGDGTVVFRDPAAVPPELNDGVFRSVPFQTVNIGEEGIQAILAEALGPGGIAIAQGPYQGLGADFPTSTFTVFAGGQKKEVSVSGLSPEMHPQNVGIVTQLARFADKLGGFGKDVAAEAPYVPAAYRGILINADQAIGPVLPWPWPGVKPSDFKAGANEFFMTRAMTQAEVDELGIPQIGGGMNGISVSADGKIYTFALRPLLPDEAS
jgi:hypothetical protein